MTILASLPEGLPSLLFLSCAASEKTLTLSGSQFSLGEMGVVVCIMPAQGVVGNAYVRLSCAVQIMGWHFILTFGDLDSLSIGPPNYNEKYQPKPGSRVCPLGPIWKRSQVNGLRHQTGRIQTHTSF